MLNYQTTSFHDALYARRVLGLRPAPEFEDWLRTMQIAEHFDRPGQGVPPAFRPALQRLRLSRAEENS
jgi:ethanolamine ammonia-lyase large subunit